MSSVLSYLEMEELAIEMRKEIGAYVFVEYYEDDVEEFFYIGICQDVESDAYIYVYSNKSYAPVLDNTMVSVENYETTIKYLEKIGYGRI